MDGEWRNSPGDKGIDMERIISFSSNNCSFPVKSSRSIQEKFVCLRSNERVEFVLRIS